jgi:hypothetical protein
MINYSNSGLERTEGQWHKFRWVVAPTSVLVSNFFYVLPPLSPVLAFCKRKKFVQFWKYRGASRRWHLGEVINIVAQQKVATRWNQKIPWSDKRRQRGEIQSIVLDLKEGIPAKTTRSWWIWKKASRQRLHDRGGFKRRPLSKNKTIVAVQKIFTPILKAESNLTK